MKNHLLKLAGSVLITALLLWAIFSERGLEDFVSIIANVEKSWLAIYLCLSLTALPLRALRYRLILRVMTEAGKNLTIMQAVIVAAIRNALVDFLPARLGEASYIYVVSRYGIPLTAAVSSFGFCFLLDVVILFIIIGLTAFFAAGSTPLSFAGAAVALAFCLVGIGSIFILIRWGDDFLSFCAKVATRWPKVKKVLLEWASELEGVRQSGSAYMLVVLTLGLRLAKYTSLYVLLLAVVHQWNVGAGDLPALPVTVAFIAAEAGASLPISGIMSFGAYEGAWTAVFSSVCRGPCEAIPVAAVALAVHLITQVVGYSIGMAAAACFLLRELRKSGEITAA